MYFNEFNLSSKILNSLKRIGFEEATLIQERTIPEALKGKDIIGQSQTGSGKTAAFGLPIIHKISQNKVPQVLILTPTRELCEQVSEAMQNYAYYTKLSSRTVYGGVSYNPQIRALKNAEIIVATPGRLLDHIRQGNTNLRTIEYLVIDEADKMFEMGFIDDIKKIISYITKNRQTFLFSATFPPEIQKLTLRYLNDPITVETDPQVDSRYLKQTYYRVGNDSKLGLLLHLLKEKLEDVNAIIFCSTRKEVDFLTQNLRTYDVKVAPLHGGFSQHKRQSSINALHEGKTKILVATDVAARGLDIRTVNYIFNWDIPPTRDEYIHRIGRTARAGDRGHAISFVSMQDKENFTNILGYGYFNIKLEQNPSFKKTHMVRGNFPQRGNRSSRGNKFARGNKGFSERKNYKGRRERKSRYAVY
ncbi:MAG: putative ATP-dependent RNA helicase [Candidatus Heimdallarchaeota archaeon LC_3]|nr:MAG: putative ATP-dependent RNA helicase [Candidatus Heimdallarchaeota archaeon LC_3]